MHYHVMEYTPYKWFALILRIDEDPKPQYSTYLSNIIKNLIDFILHNHHYTLFQRIIHTRSLIFIILIDAHDS